MQQTSLNHLTGTADFDKYNHWITTVGALRDALKFSSDDTLVRLSFVGVTSLGDYINADMAIECIGHSIDIVDGQKVPLVYINGTKKD